MTDPLAYVAAQVLDDLVAQPRDLPAFAEICPPPLHRWFVDRDHRFVALILEKCLSTGQDVLIAAAEMPFLAAIDTIAGRGQRDDDDRRSGSLLEALGVSRIGGLAISAERTVLQSPTALASDRWRLLRIGGIRRQAIEQAKHTAHMLSLLQPGEDPGDLIAQGAAALGQCAGMSGGDQTLGDGLASAISQAQADAADRARGQLRSATWGLAQLDQAMPMRRGGLYVLAAPTGGGKTSLALQAAAATAKGAGRGAVAICSLEMGADELSLILASNELGIGAKWIRDRWEELSSDDQSACKQLANSWQEYGEILVHGADKPTIETITAWIRTRAERGCSLVIVDYLNLIDPGKLAGKSFDAIERHTRMLKLAAKNCRVPVLLLAQLNREDRKTARNKDGTIGLPPEPQMTGLKGGSSIENDADGVVMIWPKAHPKPGKAIPVELIIPKNRKGERSRIPASFSGASQRFIAAAAIDPRPEITKEQRDAANQAAAEAFT